MSKNKSYSKAPIIEVMCVWSVESPESLTEDRVKIFKQNIGNIFPNYSDISDTQSGLDKKKYLFENNDRTTRVTLRDLTIEYHIMRGYTSSESMYGSLMKIYEAYTKTIPVKNVKFCQFGYLNKITVQNKTVTLSDYFTFTPNPQKTLLDFIIGYEIEDEMKYRTSLSLSPTKSYSENEATFILDIRGSTPFGVTPKESFTDILHRIHDNIEKEFESAITDKTRALFGDIND